MGWVVFPLSCFLICCWIWNRCNLFIRSSLNSVQSVGRNCQYFISIFVFTIYMLDAFHFWHDMWDKCVFLGILPWGQSAFSVCLVIMLFCPPTDDPYSCDVLHWKPQSRLGLCSWQFANLWMLTFAKSEGDALLSMKGFDILFERLWHFQRFFSLVFTILSIVLVSADTVVHALSGH
jgi:hypothetical protein